MDVILHLGAHRTGTATFDDYMRRHAEPLATQGLCYWGPRRARQGVLSGEVSSGRANSAAFKRAQTGVRKAMDRMAASGVDTLIISAPNMLGSIKENLSAGSLYASAADRVAQLAQPLKGRLKAVIFSPRSLEVYWCSAVAQGVAQGHAVPSRRELHQIAQDPRSWRDVITEISKALPGIPVRVLPFERFSGRPDAVLVAGAGMDAPFDARRKVLNPSPKLPDLRRAVSDRGDASTVLPFGMGRWNPFTNEEHAILREKHADDMMWLASGADGLAELTEDCLRDRAGLTPPRGAQAKGQRDELEERHMARPG